MSSIRLDGKIILITGATKGIGRALTLELAARGAMIVGTARSPGTAAQIAEEAKRAGGGFTFVQADVSSWKDCMRTVAVALEKHGRIDVLINNAGTSLPQVRMDKIEESDWRTVIGPTMEGTVFMTRGVLPKMIEQKDGVIINIASGAGVSGLATMGAYCMAKAAVIQHAKVVAIENMGTGVRANAIIVGPVETELSYQSLLAHGRETHGQSWAPNIGSDGERNGASLGAATIRPEALAAAVMLLCTEEAKEINGGAISVDRGFSAGMYNSTVVTLGAAGLLPL